MSSKRSPRSSRDLQKRAFDIGLCLITAPIWAPALGTIALLVLVLDGRPVFFRQTRLGRGGQRFVILKARTMTTETDVQARRPTRLGALFRDRGWDELFQVLNILRGDMSVVGPRPLSPQDFERLAAGVPGFARRLEVRPGLTGPCQVASVRGAVNTARVDAAYADTHTVGMDIGLILRTLLINVLGKKRVRRWFPRLTAVAAVEAPHERPAVDRLGDVPRAPAT